MRALAVVLPVGIVCVASGFYAGWVACQRSGQAGAQVALERGTEAIKVGRQDEALQFAFAALGEER